ncbi:MAG: class I SAM-dependent methyltransferase [Bacteroidetes bacterium]|nr:class I SAM-dependent methyltransferase [Bacteroidota bacterium]
MNKQIFLPGLRKQLKQLIEFTNVSGLNVLVIGASSVEIAEKFSTKTGKEVEMIVEDYDSLINSKIELSKDSKVNIKLMNFELTDYSDSQFDLIYAQASISTSRRNKIVKEIKRILKSEGLFSLGEIVNLQENAPPFVENIYSGSDLKPLFIDELETYYSTRDFQIVLKENFSATLHDYYSSNLEQLRKTIDELSDREKSYYKKLLNRLSHDSKAYLNQGADKFIGFEAMVLKKK